MKKILFLTTLFLMLSSVAWSATDKAIIQDNDSSSCVNVTGNRLDVNTTIVDSAGNSILSDDEFIPTIDIGHAECHDGDHYFYTDSAQLASAASMSYLISTTGTVDIHMTVVATGSAITQFNIYESTDLSGTGAKQVCQNNDRNSTNQSTMSIWDTVQTVSTDGTLIYTIKSGSATTQSRSPSTEQRGHEIILKRNTKYLFRTTSGTADNLTNLQIEWYELS